MATAQSLISRAYRLLGVASTGETLSGDETADALEALNAMLDSWRNERLMVYATRDESLTLVNAQASYTIGPSGDLNTTRPVRIDAAYVRSDGYDYPVELLSEREWALIYDKSLTSDLVQSAHYAPTMPTGTLYVWPVPTTGDVLHLLTWTPLSLFASASESVSLPPGYERAMAYGLAMELAPEHGVMPSPVVISTAAEAKAAIKRRNSQPIKAHGGLEEFAQSSSDIITGV